MGVLVKGQGEYSLRRFSLSLSIPTTIIWGMSGFFLMAGMIFQEWPLKDSRL